MFQRRDEDYDRNPANYMKTCKKVKWWGIGLIALAIVNAADFRSPYPIPLVGFWAFVVSAILLVIGIYLLIIEMNRFPSARMLMFIAERYRGYLTTQVLVRELGVDPEKADNILLDLLNKKLVVNFNKKPEGTPVSEIVFKFVGVSAPETKTGVDVDHTAVQEAEQSTQTEMTADELNAAILSGSLDVGPHGVGLTDKRTKRRRR